MTRDQLDALTRRFHGYVDGYREPDGTLHEMLRLKLEHTCRVVDDARLILAGEAWPEEACVAGEACAWLHDVGRFSQFREFGTFQDARSVDHAVRSVAVVSGGGWLDGLAAEERKRVLAAVAAHNKRELPVSLDAATAALAHLVRDADKLDIFRVMEEAVRDGALERNPEIAWGLRLDGPPSPEVMAAVEAGETVSYGWIRSLSDFILIQVGWLNGGFQTETALRLARERRVLAFREAFLGTLSDDPGVGRCCEAARRHLRERLGGGGDE